MQACDVLHEPASSCCSGTNGNCWVPRLTSVPATALLKRVWNLFFIHSSPKGGGKEIHSGSNSWHCIEEGVINKWQSRMRACDWSHEGHFLVCQQMSNAPSGVWPNVTLNVETRWWCQKRFIWIRIQEDTLFKSCRATDRLCDLL